jgi:cellulose biosynthesis protein BcsQ
MTAQPISLILVGRSEQVATWEHWFSSKPKYQTSYVTEPDALLPATVTADIVLVDSMLFTPASLIETLNQIPFNVGIYVKLPNLTSDQAAVVSAQLRKIPTIKQIFNGQDAGATLNKLFGEAAPIETTSVLPKTETLPTVSPALPGKGQTLPIEAGDAVTVAVWAQAGGVGKTTTSSNLAYDLARRGLPTLLVGLGSIDDLPLIMGLKSSPNFTNWQATPTADGLRSAIQKCGHLDVIGGFPDVISSGLAAKVKEESPQSIGNLVRVAGELGYKIIVLDTPQDALAAQAVSAANQLVIVSMPTTAEAYRTAAAYQMVTGINNLGLSSIHIVLNRLQNRSRLDLSGWQRAASESLGRTFPAVTAIIPNDPKIGNAQDQREIPVEKVRSLSRSLAPLVEAILRSNGNAPGEVPQRVRELGFIRVIGS